MISFVASGLHAADVILKGRRQEKRMLFRFETPIEIREVRRSDLVDAVDGINRFYGEFAVHGYDGGLWRPLRLLDGRRNLDINMPWNDPPWDPSRTTRTMDAESLVALRAGIPEPTTCDPLRRPISVFQRTFVPIQEFRRLEDVSVKDVLWTERPAREAHMRAAAAALLVVDGELWNRVSEPVLHVEADTRFTGAGQIVDVSCEPFPQHSSLLSFRLDRMEDLRRWETGAGRKILTGRRADSQIPFVGSYRIHRPEFIVRNDAAWIMLGRFRSSFNALQQVLPRMRSSVVDQCLHLREALADVSAVPDVCALYDEAADLAASVAAFRCSDKDEFVAVRNFTTYMTPVLERWEAVERERHVQPVRAIA